MKGRSWGPGRADRGTHVIQVVAAGGLHHTGAGRRGRGRGREHGRKHLGRDEGWCSKGCTH